MAAFRYLGATIASKDAESKEIIASMVIFVKPAIIEQDFRSELSDIAKRYRKIKSVDETSTIMIVKINDDVTLNKKALLGSVLKAQFSYADLLALTVSTTPVLEDALYIESGLNMTNIDVLIPDWYDKINTRTTVKLRKKDSLTLT